MTKAQANSSDHATACTLIGDPRLILIDEPSIGLSPNLVHEVFVTLRKLRDKGVTVLMVEHHMEVVTGLAQRIAVMHHGALLACDTPAAIMANETVQSAYLGEAL